MNNSVVIGQGDINGAPTPLALSPEDRRQHVYIIGKSGVGKSTLLENMAMQDILAGRGTGFIDPHGESAENLLARIPGRLIKKVVYFDPSDAEFPIGLNVLRVPPTADRTLVASGVIGAFKAIWRDSWGPRTEYILHAAILALMESENVSLLGLHRMLADERYRAWVIKQVKDPMVRAMWERELGQYDRKYFREIVGPIQNKVGQLIMAPQMRNIIGQVRSKIDARFMMDDGRIFIANLSKGKLGEDQSNLMGALLVTQFQLAAMSRASVSPSERRDFGLYVDEFQSFTSDSFVSILSEARKYRLSLALSHQYAGQLKPEIQRAIFGNVGSIIAFRVGHEDARLLEQTYGAGFPAERFTSLNNREVLAKLLVDGQDREPVFGRTLPPFGDLHGKSKSISQFSRQRYATNRERAERRIEAWIAQKA